MGVFRSQSAKLSCGDAISTFWAHYVRLIPKSPTSCWARHPAPNGCELLNEQKTSPGAS